MIQFNNIDINGCYRQNKWSNTFYQDRHRKINWKTKEEMVRTNTGAGTGINLMHDRGRW